MPIKVIDIIDERNNRVLLVKKGELWMLPGGVIEKGESELDCLKREIARELGSEVARVSGKLDKVFSGVYPISGVQIEVSVVLGDIAEKHMSDAKKHGAGWFSRKSISKLKLSDVTRQILQYYFSTNRG